MARRTLPWLVLVVATLAAAVLVLGSRGSGRRERMPLDPRAVTAIVTVAPRAHLFGDRIVAELELAVNRDLTAPSRVRVEADFLPYRLVGPAERTRQDLGRSTLLRYVFPLQCLGRRCAPLAPRKTFSFPPATVRYVLRPDGVEEALSVPWPQVSVASRLAAQDLARPNFRVNTSHLPPVSYRVGPTVRGWALVGAAAFLVLAAGAALAWHLRPRPPLASLVEAPADAELSPVERALALVEREAASGEERRRTALDRLARALQGAELSDLAQVARRLAWSESIPEPSAMGELLASVRHALGEAA